MSTPPAVVFGTGVAGRRAARYFRRKYRIVAFADNDPSCHGTRVMGRPVVAADALLDPALGHVLIASRYADDILAQLLDLGVEPQRLEIVARNIQLGEYEPRRRPAVIAILVLAVAVASLLRWWLG